MKPFDFCKECKYVARPFVNSDGDLDRAKILIISDVPGKQEVIRGKVFVGPSGNLLRSALIANEVPLEDIYITNTIVCGVTKDFDYDIAKRCFYARMEGKRFEIALALGRVARHFLMHELDDSIAERKTAIYHPAYCLCGGMQKSEWVKLLGEKIC